MFKNIKKKLYCNILTFCMKMLTPMHPNVAKGLRRIHQIVKKYGDKYARRRNKINKKMQ